MSVPADVEIFPDADALAISAAERIVAAAAEAIRERGVFVLALAGGSTPRRTYDLLAGSAFASRLAWPRVQLLWGDERCVPPGDTASNYRMARESFLDRVPIPEANVHRIHGEDDPATAAARYETTVRGVLGTAAGPPRAIAGARIDLVLLGLGADGHTASLFPGGAAANEQRRWVMAEYAAAAGMWRITLTPIVINAAAEVLFLVAGREKAGVVRDVLEGEPGSPDMPARVIAPVNGRVRWYLDASAASDLRASRDA